MGLHCEKEIRTDNIVNEYHVTINNISLFALSKLVKIEARVVIHLFHLYLFASVYMHILLSDTHLHMAYKNSKLYLLLMQLLYM